MQPMNNRQNGRRRGRNNNQRPQGGGGQSRGGDSGNRIDSRARGNAAQLLEKYKNLAREAQMSGDRVQTEYYLQFADHYFRVLADSRARQEEQRPSRQDDRYDDQSGIDDGAPFGFGDEGEQGDPGDDGREQGRDREPARERDQSRDRDRDRDQNRGRRERGDRNERRERGAPAAEDRDSGGFAERANESDEESNDSSARRPAGRLSRRRGFEERDTGDASAAIDAAVLPPAIGSAADSPAVGNADEAPAPRRRAVRARKPAADAAGSADAGERGADADA